MLFLIEQRNRVLFKQTIKKLHEKRYDVFCKELGWDLNTVDNLEVDEYDHDSTVNIVSYDAEHGIVGGVRLLPTTGSNMVKNTFGHLIKDKSKIPCSPHIWEASRFFFRKPKSGIDRIKLARRGTAELFISMIEFGITWNLDGILTLTDIGIEKLIKLVGWEFERICPPVEIDGKECVIGVMPTDEYFLRKVRAKAEIEYPLLFAPIPIGGELGENLKINGRSNKDLLFFSSADGSKN